MVLSLSAGATAATTTTTRSTLAASTCRRVTARARGGGERRTRLVLRGRRAAIIAVPHTWTPATSAGAGSSWSIITSSPTQTGSRALSTSARRLPLSLPSHTPLADRARYKPGPVRIMTAFSPRSRSWTGSTPVATCVAVPAFVPGLGLPSAPGPDGPSTCWITGVNLLVE